MLNDYTRNRDLPEYLMISSRIGPSASFNTGVAIGHSYQEVGGQAIGLIAQYCNTFHTSISITDLVPIVLKPMLNQSGFGPSPERPNFFKDLAGVSK